MAASDPGPCNFDEAGADLACRSLVRIDAALTKEQVMTLCDELHYLTLFVHNARRFARVNSVRSRTESSN